MLLIPTVLCTQLFSTTATYSESPIHPALLDQFAAMNRFAAAALCPSVYQNYTFHCGTRCSPTAEFYHSTEVDSGGAAYVVLEHSSQDIVVAFRGSQSAQDYYHDFNFKTSIPVFWNTTARVHSGFLKVYTQLRDELIPIVQKAYQSTYHRIRITGHSLGGALAILFAIDLKLLDIPTTVYTFGQPRLGNSELVNWSPTLSIHQIISDGDIVPTLPPLWLGYEHLKSVQYIIRDGSTFECDEECLNRVKLDFSIHANGYFWNTSSIAC
jgi:predicted lipase